MKKLLISLLTCLFFGSFVYSQDLNEIKADKKLKEYLQNECKFLSQAQDNLLLKKLADDKNLTREELPAFYQIFNTDEKAFTNYLNTQNALLINIEKKYHLTSLTDAQLNSVIGTILEEIIPPIKDGNEIEKNCSDRFINCISLAAATAFAAHAGCIALDPSIIGGVICHGTVALIQHLASNECGYTYEDCMGI